MGEFFITLFLFVSVAAITFVIFSSWAVVLAFKGIGRLFGNLLADSGHANQKCANQICGQVNPPTAQFCRRCGRALRPRFV